MDILETCWVDFGIVLGVKFDQMLYNLYCGSLNESLNNSFTLTLSHGKILVYQVFE